MIEHSKLAAAALGALSGLVPGVVASLSSVFSDIRVILVIVSLLVTLGGGLIGLFVQKMMRDREDQRRAEETARAKELDERLRAIEREVAETKGLFSETLAKSETLRAEVLRAVAKAEELDARLRTGAETFARMDGRLTALEGRRR